MSFVFPWWPHGNPQGHQWTKRGHQWLGLHSLSLMLMNCPKWFLGPRPHSSANHYLVLRPDILSVGPSFFGWLWVLWPHLLRCGRWAETELRVRKWVVTVLGTEASCLRPRLALPLLILICDISSMFQRFAFLAQASANWIFGLCIPRMPVKTKYLCVSILWLWEELWERMSWNDLEERGFYKLDQEPLFTHWKGG